VLALNEEIKREHDSHIAAALHARAERAEQLVTTLRAHLDRARVQTRKAEKEAEEGKVALQEQQREMQRQARAGARDVRAACSEAERRLKKAEAEANRFFEDGRLLGSMLQVNVGVHARTHAHTHTHRERDIAGMYTCVCVHTQDKSLRTVKSKETYTCDKRDPHKTRL
jgi:phage-related tail protein